MFIFFQTNESCVLKSSSVGQTFNVLEQRFVQFLKSNTSLQTLKTNTLSAYLQIQSYKSKIRFSSQFLNGQN